MKWVHESLQQLHTEEHGATAAEYIIILTLVACFVVAIVKLFGFVLEHKYANANNAVSRRVTF